MVQGGCLVRGRGVWSGGGVSGLGKRGAVWGVSGPGGVVPRGRGAWSGTPPPLNRMNDRQV